MPHATVEGAQALLIHPKRVWNETVRETAVVGQPSRVVFHRQIEQVMIGWYERLDLGVCHPTGVWRNMMRWVPRWEV